MILAGMIAVDENLFICDMAQTYHVLDYKALPVPLLAVLASGLGYDSRIKRKIAGMREIPQEVLLAHIADNLKLILTALTSKKVDKNRIKLFRDYLFEDEKENGAKQFTTGTDFLAEWDRLRGRINGK